MHLTPAELRHSLRGTFNALKLCVSAFEMPLETSEKLEFLSDVESSADKFAELLDAFESQNPDSPPDGSPAAAPDAASAGASVATHVR